MRTNGFALFVGPGAGSRARNAMARVQRFGRKVLVTQAHRVNGPGKAEASLAAFSLDQEDGEGYPVVHGFMDAGTGEFARIEMGEDGFRAARDRLGTRGLYVDASWTCVASDHRFIQGRPRLLPPGAALELASRRVVTSELGAGAPGVGVEDAAKELAELLTSSVRRRVAGARKVAVSFSGGLDSSVVALLASREAEVVLCSAFAGGSRDESQTRAAADALGLELVVKEVGRREVAEELRFLDLPFLAGPMDMSLWSLYSTTSRMAAEQGAGLILLGQLADELFGGYMKYALTARRSPSEAERMMRADTVACGTGAFIRDEQACARFTEARFPFADEAVASFALGLPMDLKIAGGERKVVLKRAASILGLPEMLVEAPKKAAQYSSGIAKLVA